VEKVQIDFQTKRAFILGNGASCGDDAGTRMSRGLEKAGYGGRLVEIKKGS